ncbi:MAG: hypothetical protein PG981_000361 [Wolbachia endosymbiont of Ctenocephalides orientis wCori]|nr:MAG: hypothetical protein PG981_000361 [Wolbachia endosymbiont of Ctenocephalides orientis wCori]
MRAFIGLKPEPYVEELIEEKQINNQLVNQGLEYLKQHRDIKMYVFPTGKSVIDSCKAVEIVPTWEPTKLCGPLPCTIFPGKAQQEKCTTKFQVDLNNTVLLDKKMTGIKWSRARPDNPSEGELFCLPKGDDELAPSEGTYYCENTIGIKYSHNRTGNYTLVALDKGNDRAKGFKDSSNIFLVDDDGFKELHGGDKDDIFSIQGNNITGDIDGKGELIP